MNGRTNRTNRVAQFVLFAFAFIVSIIAASNLMPLLLHAVTRGLNFADGVSIMAYSVVGAVAVGILARAIYRLDRRAGRIRNKVEWLE